MDIGIIGLGRMGMNMSRRLFQGGHRVVVSNRSLSKVDELAKEGALASSGLEDLVSQLKAPRVVLVMLPAGPITDQHIDRLATLLQPGDLLIDGGNTYYKDDLLHAERLKTKG